MKASAEMGRSEEMEPEEEKKKLNEEFVEFIRKRSETDAPRYTARLKTYVDFQRKRDRATAARRNHTAGHHDKIMAAKKKPDDEQKDKGLENADHISGDNERLSRRRDGDKCSRARSMSRSRSGEPLDRCGRRRKKRRRSCRVPQAPVTVLVEPVACDERLYERMNPWTQPSEFLAESSQWVAFPIRCRFCEALLLLGVAVAVAAEAVGVVAVAGGAAGDAAVVGGGGAAAAEGGAAAAAVVVRQPAQYVHTDILA